MVQCGNGYGNGPCINKYSNTAIDESIDCEPRILTGGQDDNFQKIYWQIIKKNILTNFRKNILTNLKKNILTNKAGSSLASWLASWLLIG